MSSSGIDNLKIMISQTNNGSEESLPKNYQFKKSYPMDLQIDLPNDKKSDMVGHSLKDSNLNNVNNFFITYY